MAAKNPKSRKPAEQAAIEATPPEPSMPSVSKAEAVRRAVAAGKDSPAEGVEFLLEEFGIEMDRKTFSLNKAQQKSRDARKAEAATPVPKVEPGRAIEGILAPPRKKAQAGGGDLIEVMERMKPLIAQHGAEQVKRLVDLLG